MVSKTENRTVKLYVEGGGNSEALRSRCREGFRTFLERAGFTGRMPRIVACGGRGAAYGRFKTACLGGKELPILLIDSEKAVSTSSPWAHLQKEFQAPPGIGDELCHLMVVCMESWFLADKEALSKFFGQGFKAEALPKRTEIEKIEKDETYRFLKEASAHCKAKAPYGKGEHSFLILKMLDPGKIAESNSWAARFLESLERFL